MSFARHGADGDPTSLPTDSPLPAPGAGTLVATLEGPAAADDAAASALVAVRIGIAASPASPRDVTLPGGRVVPFRRAARRWYDIPLSAAECAAVAAAGNTVALHFGAAAGDASLPLRIDGLELYALPSGAAAARVAAAESGSAAAAAAARAAAEAAAAAGDGAAPAAPADDADANSSDSEVDALAGEVERLRTALVSHLLLRSLHHTQEWSHLPCTPFSPSSTICSLPPGPPPYF
jgi:hypothetical protein